MRKLLNYLLGEELVSEQNGREIKEALRGVAMCWAIALLGYATMWVVYGG